MLAGHASESVALLLGDAGMSSSQAAQRLAAARALTSLLSAAPEAMYPALLKRATPLLDRAAHDAVCWLCSVQTLQQQSHIMRFRNQVFRTVRPMVSSNNILASQVSPWELQVWTTPDGMLAEEVGQGPAFKAEIVADKNVRKVRMLCFASTWHAQRHLWQVDDVLNSN